MTDKQVRWGVLGPGKIARKFTEAASRVNNAKVVAAASRNKERAQEFADKYSIPIAYGSYEELMESSEVDAIYIATPHSYHYKYAIACLKHKKAVLCEKALAINLKEVKEMIETAKAEKVFLMEAMWSRFLPSIKRVVELVNSGEYGKIVSIQSDFGFKAPVDLNNRLYNIELGGGALLDVGVYPVFLVSYLLGKPVNILTSASFAETGADTQGTFIFEYDKGVQAAITTSIISDSSIITQINLEKARIEICRPWYQPSAIKIYSDRFNYQYEDYKVSGQNGYEYEIEAASTDILNGKTENELMSHQDSLTLMECMDTIRKQIGLKYPGHDD
ncbi:MAG: oxidoreductase [Thalassobius sp.]|nr:oxidoreductase [Thalassovita sp.]